MGRALLGTDPRLAFSLDNALHSGGPGEEEAQPSTRPELSSPEAELLISLEKEDSGPVHPAPRAAAGGPDGADRPSGGAATASARNVLGDPASRAGIRPLSVEPGGTHDRLAAQQHSPASRAEAAAAARFRLPDSVLNHESPFVRQVATEKIRSKKPLCVGILTKKGERFFHVDGPKSLRSLLPKTSKNSFASLREAATVRDQLLIKAETAQEARDKGLNLDLGKNRTFLGV